jgi:hypothetical protein
MTGKRGWRLSDGYESIEKLEVAALLIAGGVRPTNVEAVTKVCKHRLGSLWKEMHGHPAKCQTPAFAYTFLRSGHLAKQAGLFIQCFLLTVHQMKHTEISRDDPKLFLSAFGLFHSLYSPWRSLRMEQAFYVWRDFRKGALQTKFCSRCQANYVICPLQTFEPAFLTQEAERLREVLELSPGDGPMQLEDLWRLFAELHFQSRDADCFDVEDYREKDGSVSPDILAEHRAA